MSDHLRAFVSFLRHHPAWWLIPLVSTFVLLSWLAYEVAQRPAVPFTYRF